MDDTILKSIKEIGFPMALVFAMLYYFVYKVFPQWQAREKDKDEFFSNQIKIITDRYDALTKVSAQSIKDLMDGFRTEGEANRKQDDVVRDHHKQVISDIANNHKTVVSEIYKANGLIQEQNERILKTSTDISNKIDLKLDVIRTILEEMRARSIDIPKLQVTTVNS